MLKQQARLLAIGTFSVDILLVHLGFLIAYWLRSGVLPSYASNLIPSRLYPLDSYLPLLPVAAACWAMVLLASRRYRSQRTVPLPIEAWAVIRVSLSAAVLFTVVLFVFRLDQALLDHDRISRSLVSLFAIITTLLLVAVRLLVRLVSRYLRQLGFNYRTLLIIGANESAGGLAASIECHSDWGFKVLGFVRGEGETPDPDLPGHLPILGELDDVPRIVQENVVDDAFFALPRRDLARLEELFLLLHQQGIRTRFALDLLPHGNTRIELEELDGMPLLSISPTPTSVPHLLLKRVTDVSLSLLLLVLGLPMVVLIALAVKITSGGTVLYRQTRCGLNGRLFTLYKFRTMVEDAHDQKDDLEHLNEMDGPVFKLRDDPRVTRLGRVLRKFSLDEVPQLWNVLRGDMSLVGPRPPIPEEVAQYTRWQRRRLSMKPGLTCLWQISGRNNIDFNRWIELDLEYIDSWSPALDFKILLKTIPVVLTGRGAS